MSFFRIFSSFPEYSDYLNAISNLNTTEKQMSQAIKTAFDALPGYNSMQKFELHETFDRITACGKKLANIMKKNQKNLEPYKNEYSILTSIRSESSKWTALRESMKSASDRSQAEAERAKQNLERIRLKNYSEAEIKEAESIYDTAERKAKMDLDSFNDSNKRVREAVKPFQKKFLEEFNNTTNNYLEQRIQCAKEIKELCEEFEEAVNSFTDYDDGKIAIYTKFISDLEEEELLLCGEVLPIGEYSD